VNYFDTSYLARLYLEDAGWQKVRELASTDHLACCLHGKAEIVAAFHRQLRDGVLSQRQWTDLLRQFEKESDAGAFQWLPMSSMVVGRVIRVYASLAKAVNLRAADAVHLACAAENGFEKIYSNDGRLLAAAPHFGLIGVNILEHP
jgi:predicted nucleic acid-binding protein